MKSSSKCLSIIALVYGSLNAIGYSDEKVYNACPNKSGAGFYLINSSTGELFFGSDKSIKLLGKPKGAKLGKPGTYLPCENSSGAGLFIINSLTGHSWWTNGEEWSELEDPVQKPQK